MSLLLGIVEVEVENMGAEEGVPGSRCYEEWLATFLMPFFLYLGVHILRVLLWINIENASLKVPFIARARPYKILQEVGSVVIG